MDLNIETIKTLFKDESGKPKTMNIILLTIGLASLIIFFKTMFKPAPATEESSAVGVEYNLPKEEEKGTVRIGTNADLNYITRGEMEYNISRQLEEFTRMQAETMAIVLENAQISILESLKAETRSQNQRVQQKLEEKLARIEGELVDVKTRQGDYEQFILDAPFKGKSSGINNQSSGTPSSTPQNPTIPNNIPTNDFKGTSYQTGYVYDQPRENIRRSDSGFIVNSFRVDDSTNYVMTSGDVYQSGIKLTDGVTAGNLYSGVLSTGAVSSKENCPVIVQLKEDVLVKNKVVIPKDTRLIGHAVTDYNTRQIYFNINRLVLNDREIAIKASLVNKDGTPGFCSKYIDKTNEAFWKTIALSSVSTLLQSFKDITYFVSDDGLPIKTYDDTTLNTAIDATSSGLLAFSDRVIRDAQAMGAIILVNPNIEVKIMLEENISMEKFR